MAEHVSMRFGRERKPQIIVGEKTRASKRRDDRDRAFRLHLRKHSAAADGCPGNALHRPGPTHGSHQIATQLSRPPIAAKPITYTIMSTPALTRAGMWS
jgi:hypothetical protein